jgi:hypothetical protein
MKENILAQMARDRLHSPFFGAEIQLKHLVFWYLGFLPAWFFCCFLLSPPPYAQSFLRNLRLLLLVNGQIRIFFIHNKQNPPNLIQMLGNKIKEQVKRQNTNKMRDCA